MSTLVTQDDKEEFLRKYIYMDDETIELSKTYAQRTPEWHTLRAKRIGMSSAGTAAGHNPYKTPLELCKDMVWPEHKAEPSSEDDSAKARMAYGTVMENTGLSILDVVVQQYFQHFGYKNVWIEETGVWIWKEHPWLCASSDGLIYASEGPESKPTQFGTAENKCPTNFMPYETTPHYYYDQFQGTAIIIGAEFIMFNVYTPSKTQIDYFEVDKNYWMKEVFEPMKNFYMNQYIPAAILKDRGVLKDGSMDIVVTINIQPVKNREKYKIKAH